MQRLLSLGYTRILVGGKVTCNQMSMARHDLSLDGLYGVSEMYCRTHAVLRVDYMYYCFYQYNIMQKRPPIRSCYW